MATKKTYKVKLNRRRQKKTNYAKRLALLKSEKARLVVRRSARKIEAQIVSFEPAGDKIIEGINSKSLGKIGWNYHKGNVPSAYLTGLWLGKRALKKGVKEAVVDIGLQTPVWGSALFGVVKGVLDAGINVPHNKDALPKDDKINGKAVENYAKTMKEADANKKFSECLKNKADPKNMSKEFEKAKEKILKEA